MDLLIYMLLSLSDLPTPFIIPISIVWLYKFSRETEESSIELFDAFKVCNH